LKASRLGATFWRGDS